MATLILDKSMVKAAREGVIASLRSEFDFLLPDVLVYEIMTEQLGERQTLPADQTEKLDNKIRANMRRTIEEAGNLWSIRDESLDWEIEKGRSAKYAPKRSFPEMPSIHILSREEKQKCLDDDARLGVISAVKHASGDDAWFDKVRRMGEQEFFTEMADTFSSDEAVRYIAEQTILEYTEAGISRGLVVSPNFKPTPQWLSFGMTLATRVSLRWKLWKYGDDPADPKKPANPFHDTMYIATIAIADGIVSADKNLLKQAWACWPDRRANMYDYDMQEHRIIPFQPKWSS